MRQIIDCFKNHSLVFLLTAGTLFSFYWIVQFRQKIRIKWYMALILAVMHTLAGVFTVKAFAFMETGFNTDSLGNMSLFGGVFFMPLFYYAGARITRCNVSDVFDIFTVCMIGTVMCARINCILTGCCKGISFFGSSRMHWPTREIEILYYLVMLALLIPKVKEGAFVGKAYPVYMLSYGILRFCIEWVRYYSGGTWIHPAHIWAIVSLCLGLSFYVELNKPKQKQRRR